MHLSRSGDVESNPGPILQFLSIGAQNVRSLTAPTWNPGTELDLISLMCSITSLDIYGISETRLDDSIPDDQILLPGFLPPIRKDRRKDGGGVAVYISETVAAKRCPLIEPTSGEYICIEVDIKCTPHLLCFSHRPPSLNINDFIDNGFHIIIKAKFYSIHNIYLLEIQIQST